MPSSPQRYLVGNWKMNGTEASLGEIDAIVAGLPPASAGLRCAVCPPATLLARAAARATGSALLVGGQDCAVAADGAHTGDIAAAMLKDAGAALVLVGHSERRAAHGETDALVRAKAEAARRAGLIAVICVGETRTERDAGRAQAVVGAQIAGSLPPGAVAAAVVVAYEPVWAIGSGRVAGNDDIAAMHRFIRGELLRVLGDEGRGISILYGGSVKPDNAPAVLGLPEVAGALVGGASLKAQSFLAVAAGAGRG